MRRSIVYIVLFLWATISYSQDIHFSNFHTNVLNVNPALTGFYKGKYRISGTIRDQYRAVAVPYQTVSLGFDAHKKSFLRKSNDAGYGLLLNYDIAGDARFNTIQVNVPLAIHMKNYKKTSIFSFGIMPGFYNNSLEYTYLRFPKQFDGVQYNPLLPHGENPDHTSQSFFNLNAGIQINHKIDRKNSFSVGFSGNNLTAPDMSFYTNKIVKLPRRWLTHAMGIFYVNDDLDILPAVKMQFQGAQQEYHFGALAMRYTHNMSIPRIFGGVWFRSRDTDAIILGIGCNYNGMDIILNYDINISSLKQVSKGRGAMELTLTYLVYDKRKKRKMKSVKCPSYL